MAGAPVLIVTSELHGGSASYVVQLASIIEGAGYNVLTAYFPNHRILEGEIPAISAGVILLESKFSNVRGFIRNLLRLRTEIRNRRPRVIYTNTVFPMISIAALRATRLLPADTRIIHTLHSLFSDRFQSRSLRWLAMLIERLSGRWIDRVIAPSAYMEKLGGKIYPRARLALIRNSLSASLERSLLAIRDSRRPRAPEKPFVLLFVGRADRQKGLDILLKAHVEVRLRAPVRLRVAGVSLEEFDRGYKHLGIDVAGVEFLGWVRDTSELYADADLFVMPSRWEAFGLTLLEARIAGLPCVGSNVDAIPELITSDCGTIVPPDNVECLVSAIMSWIKRETITHSYAESAPLPTFAEHRASQLALLQSLLGGVESP